VLLSLSLCLSLCLYLSVSLCLSLSLSLHSQSEFLPIDYIIGTLIHEITHNTIGPHSAQFYQLMEALTQEVEQDLVSGFDSSGQLKFAAFSGIPRRLGAAVSRSCGQSTPFDSKRLRSLQVEAALKRHHNTERAKGSGQVLGGGAGFATAGGPGHSRLLQLSSQQQSSSQIPPPPRPPPPPPPSSSIAMAPLAPWACRICTYQNPAHEATCQLCGCVDANQEQIRTPQLMIPPSSTLIVWSCPHCTSHNTSGDRLCQICGLTREVPTSPSLPPEPQLIVIDEEDVTDRPLPTTGRRRLRRRAEEGRGEDREEEEEEDDLQCLWICLNCRSANHLKEIFCSICGCEG
jgi:DNA-dependent metalloprotease WSS1